MKRNRIQNRCIATCLTLIAMLITSVGVNAQNVTISPQNGSMICALTSSSSTTQLGYRIGAFGTWRHNQLSLTMTGSNYADLTEDGQLSQHSNHFITGDKCTFSPADETRTATKYIVADWGGDNLNTGYITIALPKGYRFTGYTFHLSHDVSMFGQNNSSFNLTTDTEVSMIQTDETFEPNTRSVTLSGNSANVEKFSYTGNEFGNILYFKTTAPQNGFFALTFRYIELTFTADADTEVSVLPSSQEFTGKSMLEVPFNTGKVDLGEIQRNQETIGTGWNTQRVWRYSYEYDKVTDMSANMLLYEAESVRAAQNGEVLDGTIGDIAYTRGGSITTNGNNFKFSPSSDKEEQVYYLETPVSATMSNGEKNPVQFRITEATIYYTKASSDAFHIKYKDGNTTYYLGTNGQFTTSSTQWSMDEDGHIYSGTGSDTDYLTGTDNWVQTTTSKNSATTFTIEDGIIKNASGITLKCFNYGGTRFGYFTNADRLYDNYYNSYYFYPAELEQITSSTSTVPDYTIYVYDKEGNTKQTIPVTGNGFVKLEDLNNDAIMFGVQGGKVALLNFSLKLQALNPYIDQMTVVLNDTYNGKNIRQTRTFTADDFSVGGDTFKFYLPTDCIHDPLTITFEDLYSKYGDETYDHTDKPGTSDSRYNFVQSQHHLAFTDDNIYKGKAEAASDQMESDRIAKNENVRTKVGTVGDKAFRFNNADELATSSGYLTEYPFTLNRYATQTKPGAGQFITAGFNQNVINDENWSRKTFYVFTTDETRYNIAPTTATQHRFYAFYEMIVEVLCDDYEPSVEFNEIYDKTLTEASNGGIDESAYYGVRVFVEDEDVESPLASDVATYKVISEAIKKGGNKVPQNLKQILYVDLSGLNGVYHSNSTITVKNDAGTVTATYSLENFDKLREKLAPNALIFLPVNSTDRFDNFAYAKKGEVAGSFQSANDINLTDKSPFYTPYTIQVDAANTATYKRLRTASSEPLVKKATIVLPFDMDVNSEGIHQNETEDGFQFCLRELKQLTTQAGKDQYGTGNFVAISPADGKAPANKPYMVEVLSNNGSDYSFIATQKGSNIMKTEGASFKGKELSGTPVGTITNYGTYSGVTIPRTQKAFYFSRDMYVSTETLPSQYNEVYIQPFRAYYNYTGSLPTTSNAKTMTGFSIVYDLFSEDGGITTSLTETSKPKVMTINTGNGSMVITATEDIQVNIMGANGVSVDNFNMNAGEQRQVNVPSGIYIVNNTKILVK